MDASIVNVLGYAAAVLTTVAFIPQVVLVYRTKDTKSISLMMFLIFNAGVLCWGVYGLILNQLPIILANLCTLMLALYILYMKLTEHIRK